MWGSDKPIDGLTVEPTISVHGAAPEGLLSREALDFLQALELDFGGRRRALLAARKQGPFDFLNESKAIREGDWKVSPVPDVLLDRRVEITGPAEPKMIINALNSGAQVFMADFD